MSQALSQEHSQVSCSDTASAFRDNRLSQTNVVGLTGHYPLKKADASQRPPGATALLHSQPVSTFGVSQTSSRDQDKPSLRPPRSTGGRVGRNGALSHSGPWTSNSRGWNSVVTTEEESGVLGWNQSYPGVGLQPQSRSVERQRPLRRKSESNIPLFPRADGPLESSNADTPITVVEHLQSTAATSKASSYGASPRFSHYEQDAQGEPWDTPEPSALREESTVNQEKRQNDPTASVSMDYSCQQATLSFEASSLQGEGLAETEAQRIEKRDGSALPRPHASPPPSEGEAASVVTNATIKPKKRTYPFPFSNRRNRAPCRAPLQTTTDRREERPPVRETVRENDATREEATAQDGESVSSVDLEQGSLAGVTQLESVGVWDSDVAEFLNSPSRHSRRHSAIVDDVDALFEHDTEEPRRVQRARKRRAKASAKNREVHSSKTTKNAKSRNKNARSATQDVQHSNIIPLSTRLSDLCKAAAEVTSSNRNGVSRSPPKRSTADSGLDQLYRDADAEIVTSLSHLDANPSRSAIPEWVPSRETSSRRLSESINDQMNSATAKLPCAESSAVDKSLPATRAPSRFSDDAYSVTSPLRIVVVDEVSPGTPLHAQTSRLPKPEDNKKREQTGNLRGSQAASRKTSQKDAAFSDVTNVKQQNDASRVAPSRESNNRQQENAEPQPLQRAPTSKIPSPPWAGKKTDGPPPALEWSTDGVDVSSRKFTIFSLLLVVLIWSFSTYCPLMNGSAEVSVVEGERLVASLKTTCPVYTPLVFCGIAKVEETAALDRILCPSLIEKELGYHKCLAFLPELTNMVRITKNTADPVQSAVHVSGALAGLAVLLLIFWAMTAKQRLRSGTSNAASVAVDRPEGPSRVTQANPAAFGSTAHPSGRPRRGAAERVNEGEAGRGASRPRTPLTSADHPGAPARLLRTDGDLQVYTVDHPSDAESIPDSLQTMTSAASTNTMRQTRGAARRAALQR